MFFGSAVALIPWLVLSTIMARVPDWQCESAARSGESGRSVQQMFPPASFCVFTDRYAPERDGLVRATSWGITTFWTVVLVVIGLVALCGLVLACTGAVKAARTALRRRAAGQRTVGMWADK